MVLTAACLALLCGCGGGGGGSLSANPPESALIHTVEEAKEPGAWTILIYLDADNDLEISGIHNINQMEAVGSTKDCRVVVQVDRIDGYDTSNGDWTDTRRYLIIRDNDETTINSIRLDTQPLGELNMGSWQTLRDFVDWGVREFPAEHYCLIIWDHGNGWQIRSMYTPPEFKYVASDATSGDAMNVTAIPWALAHADIDVLAFDACLMQQLEVAYELRHSARYMVGSAAVEPSPGYDYRAWLPRVSASTSPEQLCRILVEEYARAYPNRDNITQSAVDLDLVADVATAAGELAEELTGYAQNYAPVLRTARESALLYSRSMNGALVHSRDLLHYAQECNRLMLLPGVAERYQLLREAIGEAVIAETHSQDMSNSHGLAVYLPPAGDFSRAYNQLYLAIDTKWDDWLRAQKL